MTNNGKRMRERIRKNKNARRKRVPRQLKSAARRCRLQT
jgi:hypothetical protein